MRFRMHVVRIVEQVFGDTGAVAEVPSNMFRGGNMLEMSPQQDKANLLGVRRPGGPVHPVRSMKGATVWPI